MTPALALSLSAGVGVTAFGTEFVVDDFGDENLVGGIVVCVGGGLRTFVREPVLVAQKALAALPTGRVSRTGASPEFFSQFRVIAGGCAFSLLHEVLDLLDIDAAGGAVPTVDVPVAGLVWPRVG